MTAPARVAVVTGGTGSLGRAVCRALRDDGATVIATSHGGEPRDEDGVRVEPVDLLDEAALAAFAGSLRERHGRLDVLVLCAGGYDAGPTVTEMPVARVRALLERNVVTAYAACHALLPLLYESAGAAVLVGARAAVRPFPGGAAYAAAKAAVVTLAQALALEARPHGARVNAVLPTIIDTPQNRHAQPDADTSRWIDPASLASTILYLCSDAARDVSGAVLPVGGP